ncbi:MAG TPA: methyltransferase domain-containing protein [Pseudonocardiaceae bacterium]|jgi:protein-L-isoaspartate O-methyltransferase|nr:methyltransferase domain-containing protein [Pseudonocardiaceae bacterium]
MRDWRAELAAVARERFVPETIWLDTENGYGALRRAEDPVAWQRHVAANEPIVTQVDDGGVAPGQFGHRASSSTSQPSVVALMLVAAALRPGLRVLEIGTGTGWNTALLCERLGDAAVVSVEIDPDVAETAAEALAANGYRPTLVTADGGAGYPAKAPYDRVVATVAVIGPVPHAWVEQTRPGGLVITPWGSEFCNGALLRLRVDKRGVARGRFHHNLAFIRLRGQRSDAEVVEEGGVASTTSLQEWEIHEAISIRRAAFAIGLRVPDCHLRLTSGLAAQDCRHLVRLHDPATGSWARVRVGAQPPFTVHAGGPRDLWGEVVAAYRWWCEADHPAADRFGLTVAPTGHTVWLDNPANPVSGFAIR